MDLIRTTLDTLPATSEKLKGLITLVYDTNQEQHELLRKAIFAKCAFSSSDWLGTLLPHLPQNLLIDITKALSKHHDGLKNSDKGWANISDDNPNCHVGLPQKEMPKSKELDEILLDSGDNDFMIIPG